MFWRCLLTCAAVAVCAASARADLTIYLAGGQVADDDDVLLWQDWQSGNWHIIIQKLYNPGGVSLYEIRGNGGEIIDRIIIHVPCWQAPNGQCVPAGSPVFVRVLSDPPLGVRTVHQIEQTGEAETLLTHVVVTEDIGEITAQAIGILDAGRDIIGPITSFTNDNPMRGISEAYAGRHILGDLTALQGRVGIVHAAENIGTPEQPVNIRFKHNTLDIRGLHIHADIDTRIGESMGGTGGLWQMATSQFFGTLKTARLAYHPSSGEPASIIIDEKLSGSIHIGGSFDDPNHLIQLPVAGVEGELVINADNNGGVWNAPIHIGPPSDPDHLLLTGPNYPQTSAQLGGGAIGALPFGLHHASSSPPSNSTIVVDPQDEPLVLELEHYGPITTLSSTPISILRRPIGASIYNAVPLEQFVVFLPENDAKTLVIEPTGDAAGFEPGFEYRISATSSLRCNAGSLPPVAWSLPYFITVKEPDVQPEPPCTGDLDNNSQVGVPDLLMLLSAWGTCTDPLGCPADLNGNGTVGVPDLLALLAAWGACE